MFALSTAGAVFPFFEDKVSGDGVDRNSAIIGGKSHLTSNHQLLELQLGTVLNTVETCKDVSVNIDRGERKSSKLVG